MPLTSSHLSGGYNDKIVIENNNLTLENGEWLSLVGANGSGKSTLLKLLCRILKPISGTVLLDGKTIHNLAPQAVARRIAILPQQQTIPSGLTVEQLVSLGRTPYQNWYQWELNQQDWQHVNQAIAETELNPLRDRQVAQLSGGERQRAFLALALAQNPKVLLLDEPTTYLDIHYQLQFLELLKKLNQTGLTVVTVLHEINLAARYSHRIAMLKQGKMYALGETATVLTPENLEAVFGVKVIIINTPVGIQICPITATNVNDSLNSDNSPISNAIN